MFDFTRILVITAAACTFSITGCGDKDSSKDSAEASANSIENTIIDPKVDESKFGPPTELTKEPIADEKRPLGTVEIAGSTLSLSMSGTMLPNSELKLDINHESGPIPGTIRLWIGSMSGEGSLKTKAGGHGDHWHATAQFPDVITAQTALWIEVEDSEGKRVAKGLPIE